MHQVLDSFWYDAMLRFPFRRYGAVAYERHVHISIETCSVGQPKVFRICNGSLDIGSVHVHAVLCAVLILCEDPIVSREEWILYILNGDEAVYQNFAAFDINWDW